MKTSIEFLYQQIEGLKTEIRKIESKENVNAQAIIQLRNDMGNHIHYLHAESTFKPQPKTLPTIVPKQDYIDMCEKFEADIEALKEQNDRLRLTIQERNLKIQKLKQLYQDNVNVQHQAIKNLSQKLRDANEELAHYIKGWKV